VEHLPALLLATCSNNITQKCALAHLAVLVGVCPGELPLGTPRRGVLPCSTTRSTSAERPAQLNKRQCGGLQLLNGLTWRCPTMWHVKQDMNRSFCCTDRWHRATPASLPGRYACRGWCRSWGRSPPAAPAPKHTAHSTSIKLVCKPSAPQELLCCRDSQQQVGNRLHGRHARESL
jgi:hypothetical protein